MKLYLGEIMKKILSVILLSLVLQSYVYAATIPSGTLVVVEPQYVIDADNLKTGDTVKFSVVQNVKVDNKVMLKSGTEVIAKATKVKNNWLLGIPGELQISDFQIVTENNEIIRLRGTILDKGTERYWANVGWFFMFPLLFIKGNDGKIQLNTAHHLYTIEDTAI